MSGYRLDTGGRIDRSKPVTFSFDGQSYRGFKGDTLASALIANAVVLMGRSFKYHRPRGLLTAGSAEPNALVEVGEGARREPNVRASVVEICNGLVTRSQNRWPSLAFDIGSVNQSIAPFLVAGFYYKTFMWPKSFWERLYEPLIRKAAGLGTASHDADPDRYEKAYKHCDVLVIGAGPAGLAAALEAARAGARVVICDETNSPGGSLLGQSGLINDLDHQAWIDTVVNELTTFETVELMCRTTVFGRYDGGTFGALERVQKHLTTPSQNRPVERLWRIFARQTVLASGAEERPLVFADNDRPGIMQASAVCMLIGKYAVAAGRNIVVLTNNSSGHEAARFMVDNGVKVSAVIDTRSHVSETGEDRYPMFPAATVKAVKGKQRVTGIEISSVGRLVKLDCDVIAMSGGWNPVVNLACQHGEKPVWNDIIAGFVAPKKTDNFRSAGAVAGAFSKSQSIGDGAGAGREAARLCGFDVVADSATATATMEKPYHIDPTWCLDGSRGKAFVDFQNDVTSYDIALAAREGYRDVEQIKRYTTLGMATDQGKLSNVNGLAILADVTGREISAVGTTTFRPFYTPVSFGALAGAECGRHFAPVRKTPLHDWAREQGAVFVENGLWVRSQMFALPDDKSWIDAMTREVKNTREKVGLCDVSTLGKIDVQGPDAAGFINRLYCNGFATLKVGKARYGLMLREDGIVFDDGTVSRLDDDRFLITTTTANAGAVMSHMEYCHQVLWPQLDVQFTSVSDQWAQIAIAGPYARQTLQKLTAADLSNGAFPFMSAAEVTLNDNLAARLFRISFSGELAYELAVPAGYGDAVTRAIMEAGRQFGIMPYGLEALSTMRIEKGHVAGGELNGTTTAYDLGLGRMMSSKKDYIGRALSQRQAFHHNGRWQLVGVKPVERRARIHAGAHIVNVGDKASMETDQGYISSVALSPMAGQWIGLALISNGASRHGETVIAWDALRHSNVEVSICDPVFYDAEHKKLYA